MARVYDLAMTHLLDSDDFFIHRVQEHCAAAGLNFFLIEPLWVASFYQHLERGEVWPRVLLNMHSEHHQPDDIYHRLVKLAALRGSRVIDPPEVALNAFDKAQAHGRLVAAGLPVPDTLILRHDDLAAFQLADEHRALLGSPFIIKPAMGYGRRGVVLDATSEADLQRSVTVWKDAHYLLQRRILPRHVQDKPAYFRVYFVFGEVWLAWWNCYTDNYTMVTAEDRATHSLDALETTVRRIAEVTGMNFFSSEICQPEDGSFVVIDYVNDQCHMLSQSSNPHMGVPDELVAAVARKLVEVARSWTRGGG